jgi:hypothetical protein
MRFDFSVEGQDLLDASLSLQRTVIVRQLLLGLFSTVPSGWECGG